MRSDQASDLKIYLKEKKTYVDRALEAYCPDEGMSDLDIMTAMRYSLFAGGKRLRPILSIAGAEAVGGNPEEVLPVACALELIHTYSLIHDDLPIMDDDDLRRGKPTSHKVFGEALALLAGDGLLTEAFNIMAMSKYPVTVHPDAILSVIGLISSAAGYRGMVGGQVVDIQSEGKDIDISVVEFIHNHKTGALITASVMSGAILGGGSKSQIRSLDSYGRKIGLAFQISDDILDIEGNSEALGKKVGADERKGKPTYPAVAGLAKSKALQSELVEEAINSIQSFDRRADPLRLIARYIIERKK